MPIIVEPHTALSYLRPNNFIERGKLTTLTGQYIISLKTLINDWPLVFESLNNGSTVAVEKTDEGIETIWNVISNKDYQPWIAQRKIRFITSSDASAEIANLNSEHFLSATINSQESSTVEQKLVRPYTFLFTNRKLRPHRRYLISKLKEMHLLDRALWTCLHNYVTHGHPDLNTLRVDDIKLEIKNMDPGYDPQESKPWLDGIIFPQQFADTWFSVVCETGFDYPYSYRTEKIWKPILAQHPFMVCSSMGFYRDLQRLGFKTFGGYVDEQFDLIDHGQDRLDRFIHELHWLCQQDLSKFWLETQAIRLYNQQHALEIHKTQEQNFTKQLIDFMYA